MASARRPSEASTKGTKKAGKSRFFTNIESTTLALGNSRDGPVPAACEPNDEAWTRLGKPRAGDWLAEKNESGQTFSSYRRTMGDYRVPGKHNATILLVPLGASFKRCPRFLPFLVDYARAFFTGMDIELLDTEVGSTSAGKQLSLKRVSSRENEFGAPQYLLSDLMDLVRRPKGYHYYCRLGITLEDIYPGEDWNYVFGQADVMERVGVFSFARHSPLFYDGVHATEALDPETRLLSDARQAKWLRNCLHTMTHEIGHMFGIRHCIYYHCLLNGSNGPHDSAGSTFMCPVDLRKLLHALSTVPRNKGEHPCALERYRAMLQVWRAVLSEFGGGEGTGECEGGGGASSSKEDEDDKTGGGGGGAAASGGRGGLAEQERQIPCIAQDVQWLERRLAFML
uniref:Archaemetzincin-2 n=1 Tax=Florenciella parvula TaxID=236787 RepID=A0A7S2FTY4_9STRA|mmetsp:Transcript_241/g.594  ORF Transcript_241/g.594 Transcript_241/m.594 type:complete len:398 (+) Transcript_241:109-1302(+)